MKQRRRETEMKRKGSMGKVYGLQGVMFMSFNNFEEKKKLVYLKFHLTSVETDQKRAAKTTETTT